MNETLRNSVKSIVEETFEGPTGEGSIFTEARPNSGLFGTLDQLSAHEASMAVRGMTIAAHADHTRYDIWGTNATLRDGKPPEMDWEKSWQIQSVNENEWKQIQEKLREEYVTFSEKIDVIEWDETQTKEMLGVLAHSAYHLGAIRQMLKAIKV